MNSTIQHGINLARDLMVPMRDGIRLASDIYRPAREGEPLPGPFPTILCRTPYDKTDRRYAEIADFFTPRGYVTVLQDLREWPLARTRYTSYYLHANGSLSTDLPGAGDPPRRFTFDPAHPVPTVGGSLCGIMELPADRGDLDARWRRFLSPVTRLRHIVPVGPAHQQESPHIFAARPPFPALADRPDVLVFQTPPLAEPLEVTGPIIVKLWISSSAVDTDFTAKLIDVYPPNPDYPEGYHMNLADSVIRTRFRNGWEKEELMKPGQVYPVQIQLPATSNLFAAGHRLRLDISSSNFPRLDVNPNTGEPLGRHTHLVKAVNTVYLDRSRASQVILPVML